MKNFKWHIMGAIENVVWPFEFSRDFHSPENIIEVAFKLWNSPLPRLLFQNIQDILIW